MPHREASLFSLRNCFFSAVNLGANSARRRAVSLAVSVSERDISRWQRSRPLCPGLGQLLQRRRHRTQEPQTSVSDSEGLEDSRVMATKRLLIVDLSVQNGLHCTPIIVLDVIAKAFRTIFARSLLHTTKASDGVVIPGLSKSRAPKYLTVPFNLAQPVFNALTFFSHFMTLDPPSQRRTESDHGCDPARQRITNIVQGPTRVEHPKLPTCLNARYVQKHWHLKAQTMDIELRRRSRHPGTLLLDPLFSSDRVGLCHQGFSPQHDSMQPAIALLEQPTPWQSSCRFDSQSFRIRSESSKSP